MTLRSFLAFVFGSALLFLSGAERFCRAQAPADSVAEFRLRLEKIAAERPDPCDPPDTPIDSGLHEVDVFSGADNFVTEELNAVSVGGATPRERVTAALKKLEQQSAEINAAWPVANRFHFEILDLPPAIVVKMKIRTHTRFSVFGKPDELDGRAAPSWHQVGSDEGDPGHDWNSSIELYPLQRGPFGNARFLALTTTLGCAGNTEGVEYNGIEWDPKSNYAQTIFKQVGALGIDSGSSGRGPTAKDPFAPIGEFKTEGSLVTLPYCWFSAVDFWDNPSLCALDTYDLSGDAVKFRSRRYNRPDLVPIAKAIEYAEKRDYPAVRAYCASDAIARRLVREVEPDVFADAGLSVRHIGSGRERVQLGEGDGDRYIVEKRGGRWVVVGFSAE